MKCSERKRNIQRQIDQLKKFLFLDAWHISFSLEPKPHERGDEYLADIRVDSPYLNADIRVYPSFFKQNANEQKKVIEHEMCHIIVEPLDRVARDLRNGVLHHEHHLHDVNEQVTQHIARIVEKTR